MAQVEQEKYLSPEQIEFERAFLAQIPVRFKDSKIEKFCVEVALHNKKLTEAWKISHPESNAKPETVWAMASKLASRKDVMLRIHQLRAPVLARGAMTAKRLRKELERIAKDSREKTQNAAVRAIEILYKLKGIDVNKTSELSVGADGGTINITISKKDNDL